MNAVKGGSTRSIRIRELMGHCLSGKSIELNRFLVLIAATAKSKSKNKGQLVNNDNMHCLAGDLFSLIGYASPGSSPVIIKVKDGLSCRTMSYGGCQK
jgi:hypothetical protein